MGCVLVMLFSIPSHEAKAQPPSDRVRAATVHLDGGSGVCISPDGWIVTAAHMLPGWPFDPPNMRQRQNPWFPSPPPPLRRPPASVAVTFENGQHLQARVCVVKDFDDKTDVAILKAEASGLPFRPLSARPPVVGEFAIATGWPNGHWALNECHVVSIGEIQVNREDRRGCALLDVLVTDYRSAPGGSGGPLLNKDREVIGVLSRGSEQSIKTTFSRWEHITAALLQAGYPVMSGRPGEALPVLHIWLDSRQPNCAPCIRMKQDFDRGADCNGMRIQEAFALQLHDIARKPQEAARLQINSIPTIILPDGQRVGYTDAPTLAAQLRPFQFPIVSPPPVPFPDPAFPGPPPPSANPDPPPNPPEAEKPTETPPEAKPAETETPAASKETPPDLTAVRLVGLVQKQGSVDWGPRAWLKGVVLTKVERRLESTVPAKVRELMGDKLRVALVFQRLNPTRFDELQTASAIEPAKVSVVVLVGAKFEGLTGKLIEFVESKLANLDDILQGETIDLTLIFERSESERYHAVIEALAEEEPAITDEAIAIGGGGATVGGITGFIAWFRRRRKPQPPPPEPIAAA